MEKAWFLAGLMHFPAQDTLGRDLLAYYGGPHMLPFIIRLSISFIIFHVLTTLSPLYFWHSTLASSVSELCCTSRN
jgi:hypothetical protein